MFRALTAGEIATGVRERESRNGGSDVPLQAVDEHAAVATALQAFEAGFTSS